MTNSNSGYVGVVGVLLLGGALAGCVDNGNDVGFEELPHGGPSPSDNAAVVTTASGGSGPADTSGSDAANVVTGTGGGSAGTSGGDISNVVTSGTGGGSAGTSGADASNVVTSGTGGGPADTSGGDAVNVVTSGTGGGSAGTSGADANNVVTSGTGGGPADTSGGDSDGTTGAGGAPAETTPCGPEELGLNCESDEICRAVETFGPAQYSCEPNPCLEHNQANSCECAASLCGSEAPNCVMLEDDTVVACICVFC